MGKLAPDGELDGVEAPGQPEQLRCPACGRFAAYLQYCWLFESELCDECRIRKTDLHLRGLA